MRSRWLPWLSFAFAAGCNWLAGIDERQTAPASGGVAGAIVGGQSGRGGAGGSGNTAHGGVHDIGEAGAGGTEAGAAGAAGDDGSGGAPSSGGSEASGGSRASTGGAGASVGGSAGNGGKAGAGGTTSTVGCLGYANELETKGWYINTGQHDATITPATTSDQSGLFQNGTCACIHGTRNDVAEIYFQKDAGVHFNTLDLKLISPPNFAVPTIYVHVKGKDEGETHCLVLSPDEQSGVSQGKTMQLSSDRFHGAPGCNSGSPDLAADSLLDEIAVQFDGFEPQGRKDFQLCVLKLTVK